jgi:hypothetical protein
LILISSANWVVRSAYRNIVGHLVTRNWNHGRMPYRTVGKYCNVRGTSTNVNQTNTQVLLVVSQNGRTRSQLFKDDVFDFKPATAYTL